MKKRYSKNIQMVLGVLKDEIRGDVEAAFKKLTPDYTMTWVYATKKGKLFPSTKQLKKELKEVYPIKGRQYDIKNIAEGDNLVMIELIESYPDPDTKKVYRTPLMLVLEIKNGKIKTGRHYCDPDLSWLYLTRRQVAQVYKKSKGSKVILK